MIKEYRQKNNLTQIELAEILDMSWRQMQRLENKKSGTTIENLQSIAILLDIPDDELGKYIHHYDPINEKATLEKKERLKKEKKLP